MSRREAFIYCYFWLVIGVYNLSIEHWSAPYSLFISFILVIYANTRKEKEK